MSHNKVGDVLDVSHVQMTRYLKLAQHAIRQVMGVELARLAVLSRVFRGTASIATSFS